MNIVKSLAVASLTFVGSSVAQFTGDGTSYTLQSVSGGNCNFMAAGPTASTNYAAINAPQWDSTLACGRCALVSCIDARCADQTKTELVYILDQCHECKQGDLDLSPSVFKSLTGSGPARYKIKWNFVKCPVVGPLEYCLKGGSSPSWVAVQPANSAVGIKSMTINSQPTTMVPSVFYYLLASSSNPADLSKVTVSVTSIGGQTITETVKLGAGNCTTGTKQFTA